MNVELKPETEQLVQEEIDNGNFKSVNELLTRAIYIMREQGDMAPQNSRKNFSQFLIESPLRGSGLDLKRPKMYPRPIEL